ncbi:MAG: hypothetical protein JW891_09235 [Candidatus Lokiarchaeota archaeon]|nr:hypothetical protein [Candidatus Lokiarchaeota archaeon]
MSVPASLKAGPFASLVLVKKRYLICYLFLFWISMLSAIIEFFFYWKIAYQIFPPIFFYIFLIPMIFFIYITSILISLIFAKLLLIFVKMFHKPREGVFLRDPSNKDYRFWSLRNTIKWWPAWISHRFPLPFLDNLCFKMFGVKTSLSNSLFEGWVDCELVEFGKNVILGQASIVQSALIVGNLFIVKKTIIEDNVRIGGHAVVMPGTHIKKNCMLAVNSVTTVGQVLEEGWIYLGAPAVKYKKNRFFEDNIEEKIVNLEDIEVLRDEYEEKFTKWYDKDLSWKERKHLLKKKKEEEKRRLIKGFEP